MPLALPPGGRLLVATHNPGKAREIAALLENRFEPVSADALGLSEPEETEATFTGNALLKARAAADAAGLIAVADDSGLSVSALGGAPGIYSARWAGPGKDFAVAIARVLLETETARDRAACFTCALAVAWPQGPAVVVEGRVDGALTTKPRGGRGFGYDPIFVRTGDHQTFGEMDPDAKHAISHRALAFERLKVALF